MGEVKDAVEFREMEVAELSGPLAAAGAVWAEVAAAGAKVNMAEAAWAVLEAAGAPPASSSSRGDGLGDSKMTGSFGKAEV